MNQSVRNCPVCGQQSSKALFYPKSSPGIIAQCNNCTMVYVETIQDPHAIIFDGPVVCGEMDSKVLISSDLNDVKNSWELTQLCDKEAESPCLRKNAQQALEKIEHHTRRQCELRILDFGSGFGFFLAAAKERGWKAYGIEPLPAPAVYARAMFGVNVITDTLHKNTFPDEYFDVITSFQVFEHIPYPNDSLRYLSKMLKPNGLILIEIPRYDTWSMWLMCSHHRHFVQDHLNFYSYKTLQMQLKNNGLEVVDSYRPKRIMSIRHLYTFWLAKKLPKSLFQFGEKFLQFTGFWNQNIGIDIGDILAVIGQKQ